MTENDETESAKRAHEVFNNLSNANDNGVVQRAREAFEAQMAFQEAVDSFNRLNPAERAAIRSKKAKQAKKQARQAKRDKAKAIEVRQVIRKQFPQATCSEVKNMADEFVAAKKDA